MNVITDNDLYKLLRSKIVSILSQEKLSLEVLQLYQPVNQAPSEQGGIFMQKLFDEDYGWQQSKTIIKDQQSIQQLVQYINTTFRISCLLTQNLNHLQRLQPLDILRRIKMRLSGPSSLQDFLKQNMNILRIKEIQNPFFTDESQRFEAMPYFDIVICRSMTLDDGVIDPITCFEVNDIPL